MKVICTIKAQMWNRMTEMDIRITEQEGHFMKIELMSLISGMGLSKSQFHMLIENYHDVLEMRTGH